MTRVSGNANSGVYTGTLNLAKGAKEGIWTAFVLYRQARESASSRATRSARCFPTQSAC